MNFISSLVPKRNPNITQITQLIKPAMTYKIDIQLKFFVRNKFTVLSPLDRYISTLNIEAITLIKCFIKA